ncbi:MAG: cytochrome bc complex cytochrome b subunit [Desulfofustis sp.]|nr:cytochrome bc complex cytochrome b subunit [Desulfofustis sp.]
MTNQTPPRHAPITGFLFHLHPRKVAAETIRLNLSFGLGGMAAILFLVLTITGVLQLLSYSSDAAEAYQSVIHMYAGASLAGFIRNIHHWAGNFLVLVGMLHLLRVYLTGALDRSRRLNWLIGCTLLALVLLVNFTGYLLPWDQRAFWAVTIFLNMVGYIPLVGAYLSELLRDSAEVGPATLANFFAIHVGILPPLMIVLLVYHFWLIRKSGGLVRSRSDGKQPDMVSAVPTLVAREAAIGFGLCALLFIFSAMIDAPLAGMANPGESPNPAKAAWYFMGLQELLLHLHPVFAIVIVPLLVFLLLGSLPFIKRIELEPGIWCGGSRGRWIATISFLSGILAAVILVVIDELALKTSGSTHVLTPWLSRGLFPLLGLILFFGLLYQLLRWKKFAPSESLMSVVLACVGMICGLTLIGVWFRGPGMTLGFF